MRGRAEPQNKGMKLTSVERIGRSQLIPRVRRLAEVVRGVGSMRASTVLLAVLLQGVTPLVAAAQVAESPDDQRVWQWFGSCPSRQTMQAALLLSGKELFAASLPVCVLRRGDGRDGQQKRLVFTFHAKATVFGQEFESFGEPAIEGNIWLAGGDPDALLLGVSFMVPKRILLNTVHIAKVARRSESQLAEHLVMRTSEVKLEQAKDSR
jgi:hypothetical protein